MSGKGQQEITDDLRKFADERDWGQFHTPKNLVLALVGEVGELAEIFQWLTPDEAERVTDDPKVVEHVRGELADVYGYLLRLADVLGIDLNTALQEKMRSNAERYPIDRSYGSAQKAAEGQ